MTEQDGQSREHLQGETPVAYEYAIPQDMPAVIDLVQRVQIAAYANISDEVTAEEIRDNYEDPRYAANVRTMMTDIMRDRRVGAVLVAKKEGKIVGTCWPGFSADGKREISALFVDEEAQGQGVGSELLGWGFDWHIDNGGRDDDIHLGVFQGAPSFQYYRKRGFSGVGRSQYPLKCGKEMTIVDMKIDPGKRDAFIASLPART